MRTIRPAVLLCLIGMFGAPVQAATIINGSFEMDPGVVSQGFEGHGAGQLFADMPFSGRSWGIWTSGIPGWSSFGHGLELQTDRTLGSDLSPADGGYYAELDTKYNTTIAQDVFFDIGTYQLSFAYSPRTRQARTNGLIYGIGSIFQSRVTGPSDDLPRGRFSTVTQQFDVTQAGSYTLFFSGTGRSDSRGALLDDVQVSPIPLPGGAVLMVTALFGLGALRRSNITRSAA